MSRRKDGELARLGNWLDRGQSVGKSKIWHKPVKLR